MISKELLPENDRNNLESEKWLLNTEFNQAKYFNEMGHQFFRNGKYKQYKQANQLDVTKRILFVLEKLEKDYQQRLSEIKDLESSVSELKDGLNLI
jgi:hypothetical protein